MANSKYQGSILYDFVKHHKKLTIEHPVGIKEEFCFVINEKCAIVIKYKTNIEGKIKIPFVVTENETNTLIHLESLYPSNTYLILNAGDEFKCALSIKELDVLCNLKSNKRTISIEKITNNGLIIEGSIGKLPKAIMLKQYLNII